MSRMLTGKGSAWYACMTKEEDTKIQTGSWGESVATSDSRWRDSWIWKHLSFRRLVRVSRATFGKLNHESCLCIRIRMITLPKFTEYFAIQRFTMKFYSNVNGKYSPLLSLTIERKENERRRTWFCLEECARIVVRWVWQVLVTRIRVPHLLNISSFDASQCHLDWHFSWRNSFKWLFVLRVIFAFWTCSPKLRM